MSGVAMSISEAEALGSAVLVGAGVEGALSARVAKVLVENDRDGYPSHGLQRLPSYLSEMARGVLDPGAHPAVSGRRGSVLLIDGRRAFGVLVEDVLVAELAAAAAETGVAIACLTNSHHLGRLAAIGRRAAAQKPGLTLIAACNYNGVGKRVAARPGLSAALSTNPLLISTPVEGSEPFVLDISTTTVAEGRIYAAAIAADSLPEGLLVDRHGRSTTAPQALYEDPPAATMTPLGHPNAGHKGFGLALSAELMAGALAGADHVGAPGRPGNGGLFIAIDSAFLPRGKETPRVANTILRAACDQAEDGEPRWPGRGRTSHKTQVFYPASLIEKLKMLSTARSPHDH